MQERLHVLFENLVLGDEKHLERGVDLGGQTSAGKYTRTREEIGWRKKVRPGDEHIEEAAETRDYTLSLLTADIQTIWKSVHCTSITIKG